MNCNEYRSQLTKIETHITCYHVSARSALRFRPLRSTLDANKATRYATAASPPPPPN